MSVLFLLSLFCPESSAVSSTETAHLASALSGPILTAPQSFPDCDLEMFWFDGSCKSLEELESTFSWAGFETVIGGSRTSEYDFLVVVKIDPETAATTTALIVPGMPSVGSSSWAGYPVTMYAETDYSWDESAQKAVISSNVYGATLTGTGDVVFGIRDTYVSRVSASSKEQCVNGICQTTYYAMTTSSPAKCSDVLDFATQESYETCSLGLGVLGLGSGMVIGFGVGAVVAGGLEVVTVGANTPFLPAQVWAGILGGAGTGIAASQWICVQQRNRSKAALVESLCGISLDELPPVGGEEVPGSDAGEGCEECTEWTSTIEASFESVPEDDPTVIHEKRVLTQTTGCSSSVWNPDGEDANGDGFCD